MQKHHQPGEIIGKLREAEILLSKGVQMDAIVRKIGVTEQTYYRWRKRYGGMKLDQLKQLKMLEKENSQLKKLVADLSLDNSILKEVSSKNF